MKILKSKVTLVILSILALYLVSYVGMTWYFQSQVNKEIEKLKNSGEKYRISQWGPPEIPDNENGAPFYEAALELIPTFVRNRIFVSEPEYNTDDEEKKVMIDRKSLEEFRKKVDEQKQKSEEAFKLVREGVKFPQTVYDQRYHQGFDMMQINLLKYRSIVHLMVLKAYEAMEDGNPGESVVLIADSSKFSRSLWNGNGDGISVITLAVTTSHMTILGNFLEYMANNNAKADYTPAINEIDKYMEMQNKMLMAAVDGERLLSIDYFDKLLSKGHDLDNTLYSDKRETLAYKLRYKLFYKPALLCEKLFVLRFYADLKDAVKNHNWEKIQKMQQALPEQAKFRFTADSIIANFGNFINHQQKLESKLLRVRNRLQKLNK